MISNILHDIEDFFIYSVKNLNLKRINKLWKFYSNEYIILVKLIY